jgi:hypothetical protein
MKTTSGRICDRTLGLGPCCRRYKRPRACRQRLGSLTLTKHMVFSPGNRRQCPASSPWRVETHLTPCNVQHNPGEHRPTAACGQYRAAAWYETDCMHGRRHVVNCRVPLINMRVVQPSNDTLLPHASIDKRNDPSRSYMCGISAPDRSIGNVRECSVYSICTERWQLPRSADSSSSLSDGWI